MAEKKKVLAISGSVRTKAVSDLATDEFSVTIFEGMRSIPAFDPDEDTRQRLQKLVKAFSLILNQEQTKAADQ